MASLTSTPLLGRGCASVCVGIGVEIGVWFHVWVAGFGFGGFWRLGCWISGVTVEMVVVVGRIGVGSICALWVRFVICGCGFVLWCAMGLFCGGCGFVGDAVLVPWWWLCHIFFFIWFGLRKKLEIWVFLFYFIFYCDIYIILLC